jgi:hypothetical protein
MPYETFELRFESGGLSTTPIMTDASYVTPNYARFRLPANAKHVSLRRKKRVGEPAYRSYGPTEVTTSMAFAKKLRIRDPAIR